MADLTLALSSHLAISPLSRPCQHPIIPMVGVGKENLFLPVSKIFVPLHRRFHNAGAPSRATGESGRASQLLPLQRGGGRKAGGVKKPLEAAGHIRKTL